MPFFSFYSSSLLSLPAEVLVHVLSYIELEDLLQKVNRTCRLINLIIKENSILWRNFDFFGQLCISSDDLKYIFQHSTTFSKFLMPYAHYACKLVDIDLCFSRSFLSCKVFWLNIAQCPVSTLCFLKDLKSLEILDLSSCRNLVDEDFAVLKTCSSLKQLYLSFTSIKPSTLLSIVQELELDVLDICDIRLCLEDCHQVLSSCSKLSYLHLSLEHSVDERLFREEIEDVYIDCTFTIFR